MKNSHDNLEITMTAGQKNAFPDFINLQLWAAKGVFKISNPSFNFAGKITEVAGAASGTIAAFSHISADGTTPSGLTNAPSDIKLQNVIPQTIEVECITAGTLTVVIES
jgi:hypothetical protein